MFDPRRPRDQEFIRDFATNRAYLAREYGIVIGPDVERSARQFAYDGGFAADAQPTLATSPNSGIPAFLSYYLDPDSFRVLFSPLQFEKIIGEAMKTGDWITTTSIFPLIEAAGQVASYGDYSNNGMASVNAGFPQRQSYHYQSFYEVGEREEALAGLAKINLVAEKRMASVMTLNMFQNLMYAFGIARLQNYGLLNDPSLSASLQPGPKAYNSQAHGPWITSGVVTATPNEIYTDWLSLFIKIQAQTGGLVTVNNMSAITAALDPTSMTAVKQANIYGVTAEKLLRENFPNISMETAPQYATAAGNLVQMIVREISGQRTADCRFTEKLRPHRMVMDTSSWRQKTSQGGWGTVIRAPFAIGSMLGV